MRKKKRNITIITLSIILAIAAYLMYVGNPANSGELTITEVDAQQEITIDSMTDENTSELLVEDIEEGSGAEVKSGDTVLMHYSGTLDDGTKFDSSYDRGTPLEFTVGVGQVIKGWDQGVPGMKVGGKRKLTIPSDLAYGEGGTGPIPGGATLYFDIELVEIK